MKLWPNVDTRESFDYDAFSSLCIPLTSSSLYLTLLITSLFSKIFSFNFQFILPTKLAFAWYLHCISTLRLANDIDCIMCIYILSWYISIHYCCHWWALLCETCVWLISNLLYHWFIPRSPRIEHFLLDIDNCLVYTSFNPQNLRNIIKKVAKISITQIIIELVYQNNRILLFFLISHKFYRFRLVIDINIIT